MSTYLVAFVISNFDTIKNESATNVTVEVSARPDPIANGGGDFALNEAIKIIDFFSDYFNLSYPLPKLSK